MDFKVIIALFLFLFLEGCQTHKPVPLVSIQTVQVLPKPSQPSLPSATPAKAIQAPAVSTPVYFQTPPTPALCTQGFNFIVDQETGGYAYYMKTEQHPEFSGGDSGIDFAIGYDISTVSIVNIREDWSMLPVNYINRFVADQPYTGNAAKALVPGLQDITIKWVDALTEFSNVDVPRFFILTEKTYPGMEDLLPLAQATLVSLIYNRGASLYGPSRKEMAAIKPLVLTKDYLGISKQIAQMKRLWPDSKGLRDRRDAEAELMASCAKS